MGFQVSFSIRQKRERLPLVHHAYAGEDGLIICDPTYTLTASIIGDITGHVVLWEQIDGPPVIWNTPLDQLIVSFTQPAGQYYDRTFRFYVDKGTHRELHDDVTIFATPTSYANLGIPSSTGVYIDASLDANINSENPTLLYFRGVDTGWETGQDQYDQMCYSCRSPYDPMAPTIDSNPILIGTVNVPYTYNVQASDFNELINETLTYSLLTYPSGMTINESTGVINWTPTSGDEGFHNVTVRVTDSTNLYDEQTYEIEVFAAPLIVYPSSITAIASNGEGNRDSFSTSMLYDGNLVDSWFYRVGSAPTIYVTAIFPTPFTIVRFHVYTSDHSYVPFVGAVFGSDGTNHTLLTTFNVPYNTDTDILVPSPGAYSQYRFELTCTYGRSGDNNVGAKEIEFYTG